MKQLIIAGFSSPEGHPPNSAELIIRDANSRILGTHRCHSEVFPASTPESWERRGDALFAKAITWKASAILCLNTVASADGLRIQTIACNWMENATPPRPIDPMWTHNEEVAISLDAWNLDRFMGLAKDNDMPVHISYKAVDSLTNHLMYQMHCAQQDSPVYARIPWIAVDIPHVPESIPEPTKTFYETHSTVMQLSQIVRCLELLLINSSC
ncbi:MAG: hypothetical protein WCG07_03025 [Candidatus Taylorbacteria bacterium]